MARWLSETVAPLTLKYRAREQAAGLEAQH